MLLRWSDLDLQCHLLTIEPGITKNKRGRVIPESAYVVEQLSGWPRDTIWLIPSPSQGSGQDAAAAAPRGGPRVAGRRRAGAGVAWGAASCLFERGSSRDCSALERHPTPSTTCRGT